MKWDKYNPLKDRKKEADTETESDIGTHNLGEGGICPPETNEDIRLHSWKDSAPVIRLSEYLKKHKDQSITLYQSNGRLALVFEPGLSRDDFNSERGQIARNTSSLLIDAADDLKYLIDNGLIDIPIRAGPSWASELYGSQTRK